MTQKEQKKTEEIEPDIINNIKENKQITTNNINKSKPIQENLIYFKNDILKDVKDSISKINAKFSQKFQEIEQKLNNIQSKSELCFKKISSLNDAINNDRNYLKCFSEIEKHKVKSDESFYNFEFKIKDLDLKLQEAINNYDKIIIESLLYPGIIGKNNEYKTFHDLIDFLLINTKKLLIEKEKEEIEKNKMKNKIDVKLDNFKGKIDVCIKKVEEFNYQLYKFNELNISKEIEKIKKNHKENKSMSETILKKLEEDEKIRDTMNKEFHNKLKEKTQNLSNALTKDIFDINNNMEIIQDKYNEYINNFDIFKNQVNNNGIILYELFKRFLSLFKEDTQLLNLYFQYYGNNNDLEDIYNEYSNYYLRRKNSIKQNTNGFSKANDVNKNYSSINKDNNIKNILSDVEKDLTKDKLKYLTLKIKKKQNFEYLPNGEMNNQINHKKRNTFQKNITQKQKMDETKYLLLNKIPKIKQYSSLNILKEDLLNMKQKSIDSNFLINENDINNSIDENDNKLHSKKLIKRNSCINNPKNEFSKSYNKIFLMKSKEEEKNKLNESKSSKGNNLINTNKKNLNIVYFKLGDINKGRKDILLSKERNNLSYSNDKKDNSPQKVVNFNKSCTRLNNTRRLNSAKVFENIKVNQMDINFDDTRLVQNIEKKRLDQNINRIKEILPYQDRSYFKERVKKFINN